MKKRLIVIGGPTGIGKTSYAIQLAENLNAEIFSADSRQIYIEMNIGTAKPTLEERQKVRHHLIDFISIRHPYNAGMFEKDALQSLNSYFKTNDTAILVGGTGLYIDAVLYGLDQFPDIDAKVKNAVNQDLETHGLEFLLKELEANDMEYYDEVDKSNTRRITRAIEVMRQSDKPFSSFRKSTPKQRPFEVDPIILSMERERLYDRINSRVNKMMEDGLLEEVKQLYSHKHLKALDTVGYKELFNYLDKKTTLEEAVELIKRNSRRYAKRQITWFRRKGAWKMVNLN